MQELDATILFETAEGGVAPENSGYDNEAITPEWVETYINEAGYHLVPGVAWTKVRAVQSGERIMVTAVLRAEDVIEEGDFKGVVPSPEWVSEYITGADWYILAPLCVKAEGAKITDRHPALSELL